MSLSPRCTALVALDARFEVLHARRRHLRHLGPPSARVEAACRYVRTLSVRLRPGLVVLDVPRKPAWPEDLGAVASVGRVCDALGVPWRVSALDDALRFLSPHEPRASIRELGRRYRELGMLLRDDPGGPFRDHEHLRLTRPLLAAFAVAHAVAVASLRSVHRLGAEPARSPNLLPGYPCPG